MSSSIVSDDSEVAKLDSQMQSRRRCERERVMSESDADSVQQGPTCSSNDGTFSRVGDLVDRKDGDSSRHYFF